MKRQAIIICGIAAVILGVVFFACSEDNPTEVMQKFRVMSTDITSCKTETRSADTNDETEKHRLEYEALADGTLHLKDVNCDVNCAFQGVDVKTSLEDNVITIKEAEILGEGGSVNCICPVDIDAIVGPLEEGDYTFVYCLRGKEMARFPLHYNSQLKGTYILPY